MLRLYVSAVCPSLRCLFHHHENKRAPCLSVFAKGRDMNTLIVRSLGRSATRRAGLRQRGRIFFVACLPGTYSSSRLAGTRQRDRAIFSRPAQAGLTTSSVFICSAGLMQPPRKRLVSIMIANFDNVD
jgi:hypothetical protein